MKTKDKLQIDNILTKTSTSINKVSSLPTSIMLIKIFLTPKKQLIVYKNHPMIENEIVFLRLMKLVVVANL